MTMESDRRCISTSADNTQGLQVIANKEQFTFDYVAGEETA